MINNILFNYLELVCQAFSSVLLSLTDINNDNLKSLSVCECYYGIGFNSIFVSKFLFNVFFCSILPMIKLLHNSEIIKY